MNVLAQLVGYLIMAGLTLALVGSLIWYAVERLIAIGYAHARRDVTAHMAGRFVSDSWWFSEHEPTRKLMQEIANDLTVYGWSDVSPLRDKWRKWLAEAETFAGLEK